MNNNYMNWNDRFALIDHYNPSVDQICATFNLSPDEYAIAIRMREAGTFKNKTTVCPANYAGIFECTLPAPDIRTLAVTRNPLYAELIERHKTADAAGPVRTNTPKMVVRRGRKGDKIVRAFLAVPTEPVPVEQFVRNHPVSVSVLRQARRFVGQLDEKTRNEIGHVYVRQDSNSKVLMIWREPNGK